MDQRILEFIGDLRRAELRISPSEAMDALAASSEIGLEHRETFKSALATTLVKESRDLPTFDRLFDLYFLDLEALGAGLKKARRYAIVGVFAVAAQTDGLPEVGFMASSPRLAERLPHHVH